jgi:RNA polymerase sigma-70 factor (ECF subfamily)
MNGRSDAELVAEGKRGESEAIAELFARYYQVSFRTALRILHSKEDSEDAVQTAYFSAFRNLDRFREEASFRTWITRIVVNCSLMQIRERRARGGVDGLGDLDQIDRVPDPRVLTPETLLGQREIASAHAHAASNLPPAYATSTNRALFLM